VEQFVLVDENFFAGLKILECYGEISLRLTEGVGKLFGDVVLLLAGKKQSNNRKTG
jgi:hypothetical protein